MGGGISTRFALLFPHRTAALIVIDSASASGLPTPPAALRMRHRIVELALSEGMDAVADYSIRHNPNISRTANSGPEGERAVREMYDALDPVGYAQQHPRHHRQRRIRLKHPLGHPGSDPRPFRRRRPRPRSLQAHPRENRRLSTENNPQRRPPLQPRPARSLQPRGPRLPLRSRRPTG